VDKQLKPDYETHFKQTQQAKVEAAKLQGLIETQTKRIQAKFYEYRKYYQDYIRLLEKCKVMDKDMFLVEYPFLDSV
jgi:uncharacterized protein (DUF3084 family)